MRALQASSSRLGTAQQQLAYPSERVVFADTASTSLGPGTPSGIVESAVGQADDVEGVRGAFRTRRVAVAACGVDAAAVALLGAHPDRDDALAPLRGLPLGPSGRPQTWMKGQIR